MLRSPVTTCWRFTSSIQQRTFSTLPATTRPKDLNFKFEKKSFPRYIRWSALGILIPPIYFYVQSAKRKQRLIEFRDRQITDYVYIDLAKGDRYVGRMLIGVFGDAVPMTVNNFLQLAEGYKVKDKIIGYRNTKVHAVIPNKVVLAGDVVTGGGSDSLSIYGPMFPDENFSQQFLKRGDVAMYSSKANANGSQFLITLRNLTQGNGRFVVFGTLVKGHELLRLLVSDVNPSTKSVDHTKSAEPVKIVSCGVYTDPSQGPPSFLADRDQGLERKLSYGTGHAWQPLTEVWDMGQLAWKAAERDFATGGQYNREIREEYRDQIKKYLEDRRKWEFLRGTPEKRRELHVSVHQEEYRRQDFLLKRRLAYQKRQKLTEQKMLEERRKEEQNGEPSSVVTV